MSGAGGSGEAFLPVREIQRLRPVLIGNLRTAAGLLGAGNLVGWLDPSAISVLKVVFSQIGATEGSVWVADPTVKHLEVVWNSGPRAAEVRGFQQSLGEGIVSMVFMTEQPFCENRVYQSQMQSKTLDRKLDVLTCSMIAVPLRIAGAMKGVVSAVKLKPNREDAPDPAGFSPSDVATVEVGSNALGRMAEWQMMAELGGWKHEL